MRGAAMGDLFDGPAYPATPGWKQGTTSCAAARKITPRAPGLRDEVLRVIREAGSNGLTADEAAKALGKTEFAIRPRLTELGPRHGKLIRNSGAKRTNESGAEAIVWIAVPQEEER